MANGKQKKAEHFDVARIWRKLFKPEIIRGERVYTVGAGEGEVPVSFLLRYTGNQYKPGDKVRESVIKEAIQNYRSTKGQKDLEKNLKKEIADMKKADTLGEGTVSISAGGQIGIPTKTEEGKIEKGARIGFGRKEKYGKTWGAELHYNTTDKGYGGRISYSDLFFSGATDKWKIGMGGPLEFGLMTGDIEDVVLMKGLERPWNLKVDWKKTGVWVRPYFGLNYGPWYFLYNPITKGFYGGFSVWGGAMSYVQAAYAKGMNECEGCSTGKKVLAGIGELIGLSSGIREGWRAWKRSKGNFFQRLFYSISHFFKGMFGSIGYVGLQVGLVQPWRLFVNSLYRFVFRAKTPKDAKTREFTPKEIVEMRKKLEAEMASGMIDKAKDDVEMWLKYEKLPPAFKGYLMGMKDRIDIMGAYTGLPFTLFPPGWKKSKVKKEIERRTRNAIEEINRGENLLQNTVYLEQKLAVVEKKTARGRTISEEISPCVVPKDDIAKAIGLGFDGLTTQFNDWGKEIKGGNYEHAFEFTSSSDLINGFLPMMPPQYSYLMEDTPTKQIMAREQGTMIKASYYATKQSIGERVENEAELESMVGAYIIASTSKVFSDKEAKDESSYISGLINQDKRMAVHLLSKTLNNAERAAKDWKNAVEERNMDKANEYAKNLAYYDILVRTIASMLPKKLADEVWEENKEKFAYLAIVNPDIPPAMLLKYHPEFKKALSMGETADVKQRREYLKKGLRSLQKAIDAGNHSKAREIWDGIEKEMKDINEEHAGEMDGILKKERWSKDDKKRATALLRYFSANV